MLESRFRIIQAVYLLNICLSVWYLGFYADPVYSGIALSAVIFFLMNPVGIAITYHRYWSHRSFEFKNSFLKYFCTFWAMVSCAGSILGWVGIHRDHHAHSDDDNDPHRASNGYLPMVLMTTYQYDPSPKKVIDLMRDKFIVNTHKYYFAIPLVYAGICYLIAGIDGLILGFSLPAAFSLLTQNTTNYVNHLGEHRFEPVNVGWINIFNFGDGWHENHHNNPRNYTTKELPHQHDPAGWVIENILMAKA